MEATNTLNSSPDKDKKPPEAFGLTNLMNHYHCQTKMN